MRTGVFLFGGVEMDDAGAGPPAATDRRYGKEAIWETTERIIDTAVLCEALGYDSYWLATSSTRATRSCRTASFSER